MNGAGSDDRTDLLHFERHGWQGGFQRIAGVDEVGRGALAGPLVAAAVILPLAIDTMLPSSMWSGVRDSKTLSAATRARLARHIRETALCSSIAVIPAVLLDDIGVAAANRWAMEQAVLGLEVEPDLLLIDAMTIDLGQPQLGLIDGDARCLSIAAASIVAKVARDEQMIELDAQFPAYGFGRHKGYGVTRHMMALARYGSCMHHRKTFAPVRRVNGIDRGA